MNIDKYTFEEFKELASSFHSYPAPGLLLGGYMVSLAKRSLPAGCLFEAIVETNKCLPDSVQLLTPCSAGNNWMKVVNLGKFALSLYDKHSGEGFRVHLDIEKLAAYPELSAWFLKKKAKKDQDEQLLLNEIKSAGEKVCGIAPIIIDEKFLGHGVKLAISICPLCKEAYPTRDGAICRGCQGEAPYSSPQGIVKGVEKESLRIVNVQDAVGKKALHDMTQIVAGASKGTAFRAGQTILPSDVSRLQEMGRFSVAVQDDFKIPSTMLHENEAAELLASKMAGNNTLHRAEAREGKLEFSATISGLFSLNYHLLYKLNLVPDIIVATRQDASLVEKDTCIAATKVIPLFVPKSTIHTAVSLLDEPLFSVLPLRKAKVGILVTGTEVFKGLIEDKFIPIISAKLEQYQCSLVQATIVPDEQDAIIEVIKDFQQKGVDLAITTGGMSVDPDDITLSSLVKAGLQNIEHGMPILPGAMAMTGIIWANGKARLSSLFSPQAGDMQVLGVPAGALYHKTTAFDILLPRLLAGRIIRRSEIARFGEGGLCMHCKNCTWPKCFFVR